jgi:cation diffusion facilitator CzcD-associated flavoprotein CzcO
VTNSLPVAIIGAGPYGLSIAAHLRGHGVEFRIFGRTMDSWLTQMPSGMHLKSEGFASSLVDPQSAYTLKQFCLNTSRDYSDLGVPVPLDTLTAYGLAFQKKLVPEVENKMIRRVNRGADDFILTLDDGETVYARSVLVAAGLSYFRRIPPAFAGLGSEFLTHSSEHHDLTPFRGRDVVVIGGGSSAIDVATLLHEGGTSVRLVARGDHVDIHDKMTLPRPLWDRIRAPMSGVGPGWRSLIYTEAPQLFHALPEHIRLRIVRKSLPPAAGWFMKDRFAGKVSTLLGYAPERAEIQGGRVNLLLRGRNGSECKLITEHVIAATGFVPDVRRLSFMSERILGQLQTAGNTPVLSSSFQSTVPGLYFVGAIAANSFGPVLRFIVGAKFAAPRIANHLASSFRPRAIPITSPEYGDGQAIARRRGRSSG